MNYYAQGGLHRTAHYLKSKGRSGDTELIHMTKGEIKGLQALALAHGGSLTINPDTGLPEANFLKRALPTIAGIGVGAATGNPFLGAAVAGGLTVGTGGSLIQGLMAGVGAYGGAGMFSGLAEAGATQIAAEGASQAVQSQAVSQGMGQAFQTAGAEQLLAAPEGNLLLPGGSAQNAVNIGANIPETFAPITSGASAMPTFSSPAQAADLLAKGSISPEQYSNFAGEFAQRVPAATGEPVMTMENLKRGIGMGPQGFSTTNLTNNVFDVVKKDPYSAAMAAAPILTNMDTEKQNTATSTTDGYASSISPNFRAYVPPQPDPYYRAQYPDYRRRAAQGGVMNSFDDEAGSDMASGGIAGFSTGAYLPKGDAGRFVDSDPSTRGLNAVDAEFMRRKKLMGRFNIPVAEMPKTGIKSFGGDFSDVAAAGGVASLGGYSDGGRMLKGPGDGMSDSIPAMIGKRQPARLADGEFVVPADVVSHLGNGSTDAGAKKLYSMMDKIRNARTGRKKQAPAVKANRYMPA